VLIGNTVPTCITERVEQYREHMVEECMLHYCYQLPSMLLLAFEELISSLSCMLVSYALELKKSLWWRRYWAREEVINHDVNAEVERHVQVPGLILKLAT
jgi:hypothetical protein